MKKFMKIQIPEEHRILRFRTIPLWEETIPHAIINLDQQSHIKEAKRMLDVEPYHQQWDKIKKYTNEYELIHVSSNKKKNFENIAYYIPLSRSYFKMIEIIQDLSLLDNLSPHHSYRSAHLAEGPGGFIEAVSNKIKVRKRTLDDRYYGMTLRSNSKEIPGWDKSNYFLHCHPEISICYGEDHTGNLYHLPNLYHLQSVIGPQRCNLVTGDGGFDFSVDFNLQEIQSYRLILSQLIGALLLLKQGGHFVCKVFDTYTRFSIELLWIMAVCFDEINLIKPLTSRPANSERYVVAKRCQLSQVERYLPSLLERITHWDEQHYLHSILEDNVMDTHFLHAIEEYNLYYFQNQIQNIKKTLYIIQHFDTINTQGIQSHQVESAIRWCRKYNIPLNKNSQYLSPALSSSSSLKAYPSNCV